MRIGKASRSESGESTSTTYEVGRMYQRANLQIEICRKLLLMFRCSEIGKDNVAAVDLADQCGNSGSPRTVANPQQQDFVPATRSTHKVGDFHSFISPRASSAMERSKRLCPADVAA